jgi:hypothetical protein
MSDWTKVPLATQVNQRGLKVWTWFDTGAMGATILDGVVVKAGPRTTTIEWESGIRNRVPHDVGGIWLRAATGEG